MKLGGLIVSAGIGAALGAVIGKVARRGAAVTKTPGGLVIPAGAHAFGPQEGSIVVPTGTGSDFFDQLATTLPARTQQLYETIKSGQYDDPEYLPVALSYGGHTGTAYVTADALKIYGVRINVDGYYAQLIADLLGGILMTDHVSDLAWQQASYRPTPSTYGELPRVTKDSSQSMMATTVAMLDHSAVVDQKLKALGYPGGGALCGNLGKDWILNAWPWDPGPAQHCTWLNPTLLSVSAATNYGWYTGTGLIQGAANCHDLHHADYSQVMRFIRYQMVVDGESRLAFEVIRDPELAGLLTGGGPLPGFRHPGVPIDNAGVA